MSDAEPSETIASPPDDPALSRRQYSLGHLLALVTAAGVAAALLRAIGPEVIVVAPLLAAPLGVWLARRSAPPAELVPLLRLSLGAGLAAAVAMFFANLCFLDARAETGWTSDALLNGLGCVALIASTFVLFAGGNAVIVGSWRHIRHASGDEFLSRSAVLLALGWSFLLGWIIIFARLELPPHNLAGSAAPKATAYSPITGAAWGMSGETLIGQRFLLALYWGTLSGLCAAIAVVPITIVILYIVGQWARRPNR